MSSSVLVTKRPAGAGRVLDLIWPDQNQLTQGGPNLFPGARGGGGSGPGGNAKSWGGIVGSMVSGSYLGVDCAVLPAGANNTQGWMVTLGTGIHIRTSRNAIPAATDDYTCWRIICNMAVGGVCQAVGQTGLTVAPVTDDSLAIAGMHGLGIGFGPNPNVVSLVTGSANPQGAQSLALTAAPFDATQWHSYELRIQSASAIADASLAVYIDGAVQPLPVAWAAWGAGSYLQPSVAWPGTRSGFYPRIECTFNTQKLYVQMLRIIAAPTFADTL